MRRIDPFSWNNASRRFCGCGRARTGNARTDRGTGAVPQLRCGLMWSRWPGRVRCFGTRTSRGRHVAFAILVAAIGLLTALCVSSTDAQAAIRIPGTPYSVQIEASDAPLGAILDMLADKFGVRVDSPTELTDRIDGIYSGPLRVVIGRLLDSYNYVIIIGDKASDTSMRVVLFGRITAAAVSAPAVQSRPDTPASRWRTPPGGR